MNDYQFIDIRFDIHPHHFHDKDTLLTWISSKLGELHSWTYGEETGYKTGKSHFHLRVKFKRSQALPKTHLGQQFKLWYKKQYPKGVPLYKSGFWLKSEPPKDYKEYFAYPLKDQDIITNNTNYHGFSHDEIQEIWTIGKTLKKNKIKYIHQKELKEENTNNMWLKLCQYLDTAFNPLTEGYAHLFDVYDDNGNEQQPTVSFGNFNNYWYALGEIVVRFYIEHEDCQVPFNIDSKMMRYSLKKKYVSPAIAFSRITKIK